MEGLLSGKLPIVGKKDWFLCYIELSNKHLHIYEDNDDPSRPRRHLQSLELHGSDKAGKEGKDKKKEWKFFYDRGSGGKYIFRCTTEQERENWIMSFEKLIQKREYVENGILVESPDIFTASVPSSPSLKEVTAPIPPPRVTTLPPNHRLSFDTPPPPPPHNKPIHKRDSGFVSGTGEVSQTCGYRSGSGDSMVLHGDKPNSGDSAIVHSAVKFGNKGPKSASADGSFVRQTKATEYSPDEEDLSKYDWFWGPMSREECAKELQERGQIGNFIVRKNDRGDYVMSFWRKDGIHHHRILKSGNQYRFERSVIKAEGYGIPDLLDTYMKHCSDKTIGPFGGQLYPNYDVAWNPPEIDFNKFQDVLKKKADETGTKRLFKPGPEMGNNTYGGMSLEQIKDVIDKQDFSAISPSPSLPTHKQGGIPTPFAGFTPKPNPASPRPSIDNGKPNIRKSLAVPKSDRSSRSSPGHRLSTPNKSSNKREYNYATSPSHVPRSNNHTQISPSHQHDNSDSLEEEDEEQEVYIAPADMNEPIYQNHGEEKQTPYANVEYTKPSVDNDIYQNITFDGKPVTPPRRVQPQQPPQVQPRRKK